MTEKLRPWLWALPGALLFWSLRFRYWGSVAEKPFSDMADYQEVAIRLVQSGNFSHSVFWKSYIAPVVPLLRAPTVALFGPQELLPWQITQALAVFVAAMWLGHELLKLTGRRWLPAALVLTVAVAKPSVFWSYKVATEGLTEAALYALAAAALYVHRRGTTLGFAVFGVIGTIAMLNRSNYLPGVAVSGLILLATTLAGGARARRLVIRTGALAVAVGVVWGPWLLRSYNLYGFVVPFTTHVPSTFFWDEPLTRDFGTGRIEARFGFDFLRTAPRHFASDGEYYRVYQGHVEEWISANWRSLPRRTFTRGARELSERRIALTKVSRQRLFGDWVDRFLLDKSPGLLVAGFLGLLMIAIAHPPAIHMTLLVLLTWVASLLARGDARMLEPYVPLLLFGNFGWVFVLTKTAATSGGLMARLRPAPPSVAANRSGAGTMAGGAIALSIIVPAFNEERTVAVVLQRLARIDFRSLVASDRGEHVGAMLRYRFRAPPA